MLFLALDQGTSSSRTIVYDETGQELFSESEQVTCFYPHDGWVEQDALQVWQSQRNTLSRILTKVDASKIQTIGITNQRETTVVWDKKTGLPLAPAIVWQCRRSVSICERLKAQGFSEKIKQKTGLVIDAYFSLSKIVWMIENVSGLKEKVNRNEVVFGTIDSWILYNLTKEAGEPVFATEASNASRTMLYSLEDGSWDEELLSIANITKDSLCEVKPSFGTFGHANLEGHKIPVTCMLGDQQSSLLGHGCFERNQMKCTFGTGAFLLLNAGSQISYSDSGLITTAAWRTREQQNTFAIEGSVFMAGALIQWLRDSLGLIKNSSESETLARSVSDTGGVVIVPAFTGLGAPYWDSSARGIILGITRATTKAHLVRACLDAVAHQIADLFDDALFNSTNSLHVDGGMAANRFFAQRLADITQKTIVVSAKPEVTAFGAARGAFFGAQMEASIQDACNSFRFSSEQNETFHPLIDVQKLSDERSRWKNAISKIT